jgi:chaperonin GroEL
MQVFISHATEDSEFAHRLTQDLRESGIGVWLAPDSILPGEEWVSAIDRGLTGSSHMLIVLTPSAVASRWVQSEVNTAIALAHEEKMEIIPLDVIPAEPPALWRAYQMVVGFGRDYATGLRILANRLGFQAKPAVPSGPFDLKHLAEPYRTQLSRILAETEQQLRERIGEEDIAEMASQVASIIIVEGLQAIARRTHPKRLARNLAHAYELASAYIQAHCQSLKTLEQLSQLVKAATGNSEVSELLAGVADKVGIDGVITVEPGLRTETVVEYVEGLQFDRGYISPDFVTDAETMEVVLEEPYILIHDKRISAVTDIVPVLEKLVQEEKRELVVIAEDVEGGALATLVLNRLRDTINCLAVKAPGFGDTLKLMLQDIAILTGANVISEELGRRLEMVQISDLGQAYKVMSTKDDTIIIGGKGSDWEIKNRMEQIKVEIERSTSDYDREKLQERLAKLAGGVAVIRVGGLSDENRKEMAKLVKRGLKVFRASITSGFVPGEGLALVNAARELRQQGLQEEASAILATALEIPLKQMAEDLGRSGDESLQTLRRLQLEENNPNIGYHGEEDQFVDLVEAGVIVPVHSVELLAKTAVDIAAERLAEFRYTDELVRQIRNSFDLRA